jgi:hypothetical protein
LVAGSPQGSPSPRRAAAAPLFSLKKAAAAKTVENLTSLETNQPSLRSSPEENPSFCYCPKGNVEALEGAFKLK